LPLPVNCPSPPLGYLPLPTSPGGEEEEKSSALKSPLLSAPPGLPRRGGVRREHCLKVPHLGDLGGSFKWEDTKRNPD